MSAVGAARAEAGAEAASSDLLISSASRARRLASASPTGRDVVFGSLARPFDREARRGSAALAAC